MIILLELGRGIAALWVFFYHVKNYFIDTSDVIYKISEYGYLGVPMFFVISGFVITYSAESTLKSNKSPLSFIKKRFFRIYPAFWVSIVVVLFLPYLIELISMLKSGYYNMPENLLFRYNVKEWLNFTLLSKVFFSENNDLQGQFNVVNAVYWTIAIEFQFYLVIFVSLFLKRFYKCAVFAISILAIVNIIHPLGFNYGLFIHYWPSFAVGIVLAYTFKYGFDLSSIIAKTYKYYFSIFSFLVLITASLVMLDEKPDNFIFALIFGTALWCLSPFESLLCEGKKQKGSAYYYVLKGGVILGSMSYSVYLLHGKLHFFSAMFVRQAVSDGSAMYGLLIILLTLIICYPFYLFIERPFMSNSYIKLQKKQIH